MCPISTSIDLRVLDDDGKGDEFSIIAALQFIRYLNANADQPVIHGVNLSLSLLHDVENLRLRPHADLRRVRAPGRQRCRGRRRGRQSRLRARADRRRRARCLPRDQHHRSRQRRGVITVGATHRFQPHTYGVSYFSSRGPTGDGRIKPDVLAPGERIYSCVFGGKYDAKDGTSMAAPHVSGVAAMMIARHREFLGQPAQIKRS